MGEIEAPHAFAVLKAGLQAAVDRGRLPGRDPTILAHLVLGAMCEGVAVVASSSNPRTTIRKLTAELRSTRALSSAREGRRALILMVGAHLGCAGTAASPRAVSTSSASPTSTSPTRPSRQRHNQRRERRASRPTDMRGGGALAPPFLPRVGCPACPVVPLPHALSIDADGILTRTYDRRRSGTGLALTRRPSVTTVPP